MAPILSSESQVETPARITTPLTFLPSIEMVDDASYPTLETLSL